MSKPDWKDAPEWAMWLAMDACGDWGWYQGDTYADDESGSWVWVDPFKEEWQLAGFSENHSCCWNKTLERRP